MDKNVFIVVGLQHGDETKGSVVDFLVRQNNSDLVIRYNGGAQCAHRVVTSSGDSHVFAQFGSGTLVNRNVKTLLTKHVLFNPLSLIKEEEVLSANTWRKGGNFESIYVDERALVTTPFHVAANRMLEESRNNNRHGSCGVGIGETVLDSLKRDNVLRVKDLKNYDITHEKLWLTFRAMISRLDREGVDFYNFIGSHAKFFRDLRFTDRIAKEYQELSKKINIIDAQQVSELLKGSNNPVFEGAQGILLDEKWGFHPHTTWSNTTTENVYKVLNEAGLGLLESNIVEIGVTRIYATRHGAGPFPTEMPWNLQDTANTTGPWQGRFRTGMLDIPLLKYALEVNGGVDYLAVSHCDRINEINPWYINTGYNLNGKLWELKKPHMSFLVNQEELGKTLGKVNCESEKVEGEAIPNILTDMLNVPIGIKSYGEMANDKMSFLNLKKEMVAA